MEQALARAAATLTLAATCGSIGIAAAVDDRGLATAADQLATVAFALVGAIVVARRPGQRVAWVMCGVGVTFALHHLAGSYGLAGLDGRDWPGAAWAAWYGEWGYSPAFSVAFVLLPLLFPDGQLISRGWRAVVATAGVLIVGGTVMALCSPTLEPGGRGEIIANPLYVESLAPLLGVTYIIVNVLFFPLLLAGIAAIVVRFRRSSGRQRQQVKWFLAAAAVVVASFALSTVPAADPYLTYLDGPITLTLPVAIGVAVLRYRLYEIDRIISRTVSYALVFVTLAGIYATGVVGLSTAARGVTGDAPGGLVVSVSTLAAVAALAPVRRRVQRVVERRFNRRRYDAVRTVNAFAGRLRDEVDIDIVAADLRTVAHETMQPLTVSVWLATHPAQVHHRQATATNHPSSPLTGGRPQA